MLTLIQQAKFRELARKRDLGLPLAPDEAQMLLDLQRLKAGTTDLSPGISPSSPSGPTLPFLPGPVDRNTAGITSPSGFMPTAQTPAGATPPIKDSTPPIALKTDDGGKINWWLTLAPLFATGVGALVGGEKGAMAGLAAGGGLLKGAGVGEEIRREREREAETLATKGQERAQAKKRFGMEEIEFARREKEAVLAEVERTGEDPVDPKGNTTNEIASAKLKYNQTQEKLGQEKEARELALREEKEQQAIEGGHTETLTALYGGGPLAQARAEAKIAEHNLSKTERLGQISYQKAQEIDLQVDNLTAQAKDRTLPPAQRASAINKMNELLGIPVVVTPDQVVDQDVQATMNAITPEIIKYSLQYETPVDEVTKRAKEAVEQTHGKKPVSVEVTDEQKRAINQILSVRPRISDAEINASNLLTPGQKAYLKQRRDEFNQRGALESEMMGNVYRGIYGPLVGSMVSPIARGLFEPETTTTTQQPKPQPPKPQLPFTRVAAPRVSTDIPISKRPYYSAADIDLLRRAKAGDESAIQEARKKGLL